MPPANLFDLIERAPKTQQNGWDDLLCKNSNQLISEANTIFPLIDYLETKMEFEVVPSSKGWTHKTYCPFHKGGHERTPSFFVNPATNRFFCQGCGFAGGIVEFICKKFNHQPTLVAENIINLWGKRENGAIILAAEKKLQKKKANECMLKISRLFNKFLRRHIEDEAALTYLFKIQESFDDVIEINEQGVEKNIKNLYDQFVEYLQDYDLSEKSK